MAKWTSSQEINEMIEKVIEQGWEVKQGRHITLYPADKSKRSVTVARTPSDYRGIKNARAAIRRSGGNV